jgi:hypothetical protein
MNNVLHTNKRNFSLSLFFYLYEEEIYQMPKDEIRSDAHTHTLTTNQQTERMNCVLHICMMAKPIILFYVNNSCKLELFYMYTV